MVVNTLTDRQLLRGSISGFQDGFRAPPFWFESPIPVPERLLYRPRTFSVAITPQFLPWEGYGVVAYYYRLCASSGLGSGVYSCNAFTRTLLGLGRNASQSPWSGSFPLCAQGERDALESL